MRVLVALAKDEEELLRARRHLGYDRLVVVAPEGKAAALRQAAGPGAEVREVPAYDLLACLEALQGLLRGFGRRDEVRAAVDGGTAAMSEAAFLACLSEGVEAWFLLAKAVRLPVLEARPVKQRFTDEQLAVLRALDGRMSYEDLAARSNLPPERMKEALLRLRKEEVVRTSAAGAEPTALARFYQRGLQAP